MAKYNGWKNYETWNVALWISNDEGLYNIAKKCRNYPEFVMYMQDLATEFNHTADMFKTPDDVSWDDSSLDIDALNKMIEEL